MKKLERDPMDSMNQCHAKSKQSGQRCKRYSTKGMKVCRMHGGALGNKKSQEARRLAAIRHGLHTQKTRKERSSAYQLIKSCRKVLSTI